MNSPKKYVPTGFPSRQPDDMVPPAGRDEPPFDAFRGDEDDMDETGEWSGDPRFADFPDLPASGSNAGPHDEDMSGYDDEWSGDPRFADFSVPGADHGVDGVDETYVTVSRPHLRVVSVEMFNAVQALRPVKSSGTGA